MALLTFGLAMSCPRRLSMGYRSGAGASGTAQTISARRPVVGISHDETGAVSP